MRDVQEGLNTLTFTRHVSVMSITLSTVPLDPSRPGYQAPLPLDQVKPLLPPSRSHPGAALVPRCALDTHQTALWLAAHLIRCTRQVPPTCEKAQAPLAATWRLTPCCAGACTTGIE